MKAVEAETVNLTDALDRLTERLADPNGLPLVVPTFQSPGAATGLTVKKVDDKSSFIRKLGQMLAKANDVSVGQMNFVDLEPVRRRLGLNWIRAEENVCHIVELQLERHLGTKDFFTREQGLSYLLLFRDQKQTTAQESGDHIARAITEQLLGKAGDLRIVNSHTAACKADGKLIGRQPINCDQLADFVQTRAPSLHLPSARTSTPRAIDPVTGRVRANPSLFSGVRFVHIPMLHIKRQVISLFHSVPISIHHGKMDHTSGSGSGTGYGVLPDRPTPILIGRLDLLNLFYVQSLLEGAVNHPVGIATVVHYQTVSTRSRAEVFRKALDRLPAGLRKFLMIELTGLPSDITPHQLESVVEFLRCYCRSVMLLVRFDHENLAQLAEIGVKAIGIERPSAVDESDLMALMNSFCSRAEKSRLGKYIRGLTTPSQASAAACAGFDFIGGEAVLESSRCLPAVQSFEYTHLYRDGALHGDGIAAHQLAS